MEHAPAWLTHSLVYLTAAVVAVPSLFYPIFQFTI